MSELSKDEVARWIRNLIPYLETPMVLAPKGCFREPLEVKAGKVIEYDPSLMPNTPQILNQEEKLKLLIELYKVVI